MRVVFFLLDAFKEEYVSKEQTPFLYKKSKEGVYIKKLIPSAGFCERTEIFFGLKPNESGFFTAIGFDQENGAYNNRFFLSLLGWIEQKLSLLVYVINKKNKNSFDSLLQKVLNKIYFKFIGSSEKLKPYKIPLSFLKYFNLTEDAIELHKQGVIKGKESLFKIVKDMGFDTFMEAFTSLGAVSTKNDFERIKIALEASKSKNNLFIPIYINTADSIGHSHGPSSKKIKGEIKELDNLIENSVGEFLKNDPETSFVFLGDHGMSEVKKSIDVKMHVLDISKKFNLKIGKDFIFFLDSTLMRMWFFTSNSREIFERELKTNDFFTQNGDVLDEKIASKYDIPINDIRYGDICWWVNEGVLIFPDFFHSDKPFKGMHGYKPNTQSTYGTCVLWSKESKKQKIDKLELSQIYLLLKKMLLVS
ncbi:alkaline phosphatase family protein [Thalassobellus citreus]|uniref:alkaline phosphatase family protein n=1 Tax=Thalassobellus citreus TaxID=3367752 RepID=UPI0037B20BD4